MRLERILLTLQELGLSRLESEVYVYLAKAGPSKAEELVIRLRITKKQLYPALKELENKGILTSKPERSRLFSAVAFEELLNLFIRINVEKAIAVKETKQELVKRWQEITKQDDKN
jgi:sugar-specific transcriptional regulator TrmB